MNNSRVSTWAAVLLVLAVTGLACAQNGSALGADIATYVTATQDGYYAWYEQGLDQDAPTTGLPHPGITAAVTGSTGTQGPSGTFLMQDYAQNNALLLNSQHPSGTLTFATPTLADAFWLTTATGFGPAYLNTVTHFADGTPDFTQNFLFQDDWFHAQPDVYNTAGRVDVYPYFQVGGLNSHPGDFEAVGVLRLDIQTVTFPDAPPHPVSSIDIGWMNGRSDSLYPTTTTIFGVSVSANGAAGPFNAVQLTPSSFTQDVVVEASALPEPGAPSLIVGAVMMFLGRRRRRTRLVQASLETLESRTMLSATWTVTSTADDGSAGTLRQIIGTSAAGDTVTFDPTVFSGTSGTPHVITLNGTPLEIGHDLTIQGPGDAVASVSGNGTTRGLVIDAGAHAAISGLTFTACLGTADVSGGAVAVSSGAALNVSACTFSANTANQGGAIWNQGTCGVSGCKFTGNSATNTTEYSAGGGAIANLANLTVDGCDFSSNTAIEGGAVDNFTSRDPSVSSTIQNSTFENNSAFGRDFGGGAVESSAGLTLEACTFKGNFATGFQGAGGGVETTGFVATSEIDGCSFSGNYARYGGGMHNGGVATVQVCTFDANFLGPTYISSGAGIWNNGTLNLIASTLSNNTAGTGTQAGYGGGLNNGGVARVIDCTIANNYARVDGGGILSGSGLLLTNSTVSGNHAPNNGAGINATGATLNNSIVAGNFHPLVTGNSGELPSDVYGQVNGSFNLIGQGGSGGLVNSVNYNMVGVPDPGLSVLGDHGGATQTFALLPGSLALNTGRVALAVDQNGQPLTTDQRGEPRVGGSSVDVGAYEAQLPAGPPTNLMAVGGVDSVKLTWTRSTDTSVSVFRGTSPGGEDATPIATLVGTDYYVDSTPVDGVTYYYKVAVATALGQSPLSNEASAAATPMAPLVSPDGTSGFTLVRDADQRHIDWTSGTAAGQFFADDPNPVVIVGNASNTFITTDYSLGGALPRFLRLSGNTFTIQSTSTQFLIDQGNTIDIGRSTVYFGYDPSQGNPSAAVSYALKNGYGDGGWNGAPPSNGTSIVSSAAAAGPVGKYSVGYAFSVDQVVPDQPSDTVEVKFTLAGDTNLDGVVDMVDAARLQSAFGAYNSNGWIYGDFDYSWVIDSTDAILLARNYGSSLPAAPQTSTQSGGSGTSPTTPTTTTNPPTTTSTNATGGGTSSGSGSNYRTNGDGFDSRDPKHKKKHRH